MRTVKQNKERDNEKKENTCNTGNSEVKVVGFLRELHKATSNVETVQLRAIQWKKILKGAVVA